MIRKSSRTGCLGYCYQPVIFSREGRDSNIKKRLICPDLILTSFVCFQIPGFCVGGTSIPGVQNKVNCDIIVGYKSVYRMCFAMACFFALFCIIMIRVRSSKDPRAAIQNGFVLYTAASAPQMRDDSMLLSGGQTWGLHL